MLFKRLNVVLKIMAALHIYIYIYTFFFRWLNDVRNRPNGRLQIHVWPFEAYLVCYCYLVGFND